MMTGQKVYGVLLFDDAIAQLGDAITPYLQSGPIGKYLYCLSVDVSGNYFQMVLENPSGSANEPMEILIPHSFVKLVVAAVDKKNIGFAAEI